MRNYKQQNRRNSGKLTSRNILQHQPGYGCSFVAKLS